jgi:hypothetical protein
MVRKLPKRIPKRALTTFPVLCWACWSDGLAAARAGKGAAGLACHPPVSRLTVDHARFWQVPLQANVKNVPQPEEVLEQLGLVV